MRRLRLTVAGLIVGLGLVAAPAAAQAAPIHVGEGAGITVNPPSGVPNTTSLVTLCLTVRELHVGPDCVHIP